MTDSLPELIEIRSSLSVKVGRSLSPHLAQLAEQAGRKMMTEMSHGLEEALEGLIAAWQMMEGVPVTRETSRNLFKQALEVKSLGGICGNPLVTRVAHSLCRLLTNDKAASDALVDAHVNTLRALLRDGEGEPSALMLARELENQVFQSLT
jgi:hypothetical protein